ncbi:MAG: hypothetical protein LC635_04850, partial [Pseudonocardiaceae bacterium]|nr:hypothetical protein [Pseudonocardiaceae bacterium]
STPGARQTNLGVLSGVLFALLWIAGAVSLGLGTNTAYPRPTDDMAKVADYFQNEGSGVELNVGLQALSAVALLWFAAQLAGYVRRVGGTAGSDGAGAGVVAGGAVAAGLQLVSFGALAALTGSDLAANAADHAATAQALNQLSFWAGGPAHVAALGTMIAAAAYGLRGALPKWLSVAGIVVGALGMLASLASLVPAAVAFTPAGRFLGFAWILVVAILVSTRRSAPVAVPAQASAQAPSDVA